MLLAAAVTWLICGLVAAGVAMAAYREFGSIVLGYVAVVGSVLCAAVHCILLAFKRFRAASSRAQVAYLWASLLLLLVLSSSIMAVQGSSLSPRPVAPHVVYAVFYVALSLLFGSVVATRVVLRAGA